ncbi:MULTISPECIES: DUF805 domain-containing protein [unclassified Streptomyces]|uniref:DUF805 domain-containing protein n=1 Tax=unclassified Streptomyces TaxID=2593676 RepID=UPI00380B5095
MNWYLHVLKNYAAFSGRARRQEYWMFTLFSVLAALVLAILDTVLGVNFLGNVYSLGILVPTLAVSVRRLHDTGRSGWWLLINLVPLVGWIVFLVFLVLEGEQAPNAHGQNPKYAPAQP